MACAQNIAADRGRRIHSRARGHGRRLRPGRPAVEHLSSSSACHRTDADTAANGQRYTIAQPNTAISGSWSDGRSERHPRGDGLHPSKGSTVSSSDLNATDDPPDRTTDAEPATVGYSQHRSHTDADG